MAKSGIYRSKMEIQQEFVKLYKYIKAAKKKGLTYTEMLKFLAGPCRKETEGYDLEYDPAYDRGLLAVHMKRLFENGIRKNSKTKKYSLQMWAKPANQI